jgi:hypothetical protein
MATDFLTPFSGNVASYSCWLMFTIPYNLPPICMKYEFMFLCLVVPGPDHRRPKLNVMLRPFVTPRVMLFSNYLHYKLNQASSTMVNPVVEVRNQNSKSGVRI